MPAPSDPVRGYSFTDFATSNPTTPPPGNQLDTEFDRSNAAIAAVIDFVRTSLADDGTLKPGTVGAPQLTSGILDDLGQDAAEDAAASALEAAASKGLAEAAAVQAGASATASQGYATSAAGSVVTAAGHAANALTYRNEALAYRDTASTHATNAGNFANDALLSRNAASNHEVLSRRWAEDLSGPVDDGFYSARFYALQAIAANSGNTAGTAAGVLFSSYETIVGPNVQLAIEQLKDYADTMVLRAGDTMTGALTINTSGATAPTPPAGTIFHMLTGGNVRYTQDAFASGAQVVMRRANGTVAAPSALVLNDVIASFQAWGYGATGYATTQRGQLQIIAAEGWTDTAQGTRFRLQLTPIGSAVATDRLLVEANGDVTPGADNAQKLGTSALKWSEVNGVNATFTGNFQQGYATPVPLGASNAFTPSSQFHSTIGISSFSRWSNDNGGPQLGFFKSRGAAIGTRGLVAADDTIFSLSGYVDDGTNAPPAAMIRANVDGTPGAGDAPGRLSFWTTPDGGVNLIERVRINSAGRVQVMNDLSVGFASYPAAAVKLHVGGVAAATTPTLGATTGIAALFSNTDATYGLAVGVAATGNAWMQVQRVDGTATPYHLLLQPSGGFVGIALGATPTSPLQIASAAARITPAGGYLVQSFGGGNSYWLLSANTNFNSAIHFGDPASDTVGRIEYVHNGDRMEFHVNAAERMRIVSTGNLLLGTTTDSGARLNIACAAAGTALQASDGTYGTFVIRFSATTGVEFGSLGGSPMNFLESNTVRLQIATTVITASLPVVLPSGASRTAAVRTGTSTEAISTKTAYDAADYVALTDAATIAWDMGLGINFSVTLGGNRTLGAPTNTVNGKTGSILVYQDGTGGRTLAYNAVFKFANGVAPTLDTVAGRLTMLFYQVINSTNIFISHAPGVR